MGLGPGGPSSTGPFRFVQSTRPIYKRYYPQVSFPSSSSTIAISGQPSPTTRSKIDPGDSLSPFQHRAGFLWGTRHGLSLVQVFVSSFNFVCLHLGTGSRVRSSAASFPAACSVPSPVLRDNSWKEWKPHVTAPPSPLITATTTNLC